MTQALANSIEFGSLNLYWVRTRIRSHKKFNKQNWAHYISAPFVCSYVYITSSLRRTFSILKCCSSKDISPMAAGPPQLGHVALLNASLYLVFSALSFSFSALSCEFSCLSCCACHKWHELKLTLRQCTLGQKQIVIKNIFDDVLVNERGLHEYDYRGAD